MIKSKIKNCLNLDLNGHVFHFASRIRNQLFRTRRGLNTSVAGELLFSLPTIPGVRGVFGERGVFNCILLNDRFTFNGVRSLAEWIFSLSSEIVVSFSLFASCKCTIFCGSR